MINIKSDSRKVVKGDIFVCLNGISSNGEEYVKSAIENGASKIIVSSDNKYSIETIKVDDTRKYLTEYLSTNYGNIIDNMNIIGLTGTNGKTTTCFLIYQLLNKLGYKCGYIGTIGYYLDDKVCNLSNTSPDICEIYDMIVNAHEKGFNNIVMEVSSQGLAMNRLDTIKFNYAAFTNLTQDHLDYHKTMENYALAKQQLFRQLKDNGVGIINSDDKYTSYFEIGNYYKYGIDSNNKYYIKDYSLEYKMKFTLKIDSNEYQLCANLLGKYNLYNLVCAISILNEMNIDMNKIKEVLLTITPPPGRLEQINYKNNLIIIDYAHTPDAMENIYNTVAEINKGNIYTVFGCTGDRDRTKRPIMMNLALNNSERVIVTSDDLHNEDFDQIVNDMISDVKSDRYDVIKNRGKAIEQGIKLLNENDILLILGKGHEEVIIVKDQRIPFNDKKEVNKILLTLEEAKIN